MAQADAENRRRLPHLADHAHRHTRLFGTSRPWRDDDPVGPRRHHVLERGGIVTHHLHLGAELPEVLHQVVRERIVVVDDEDHIRSAEAFALRYKPAWASSSARSRAFALSRVSSNSAAGFESMTIPAPACT